MLKFEDNHSVMNPNLVYFSLMYISCAMYFSGHLELTHTSLQTACVGNTHSAVFNNDHVETAIRLF